MKTLATLATLLLVMLVLGSCGHKGDTGQAGISGVKGEKGDSGPSGPSAHITSMPADASECPTGGFVYATWVDGSQPQVTALCNGANGSPGTAGTVIQVIQVCPAGSTYPSVFSESVICMGGKVYGVYSANNGFWAYLPPGTYSSNGINSSCTFTIGQNCQIGN